jgi:hypothetical protein
MNIKTNDMAQFMAVISNLVALGLGFNADAEALIVTLTGAY